MSKQKSTKVQNGKPHSDSHTFNVVLFYCLMIIFAPIVTFFVSKFFVFDLLSLTEVRSNIYSAIAAVIALHLALGGYLYRAYFESESTSVSVKQD